MAAGLTRTHGETEAHAGLKRLALVWAQSQGYSACAVEVSLPQCRYRADVGAFRQHREGDRAAVFECKQSSCDLRRDNCDSAATRERLLLLESRREVIERNLRIHYPTLRTGESLFPDFDSFDFEALEHRGYRTVSRKSASLRQRLHDCAKFERLARYHCANLFYLVLAQPLSTLDFELPAGWGTLVETNGHLVLQHKPIWHEMTAKSHFNFLRRVASAATRSLNRELEITADAIAEQQSI